jgi:hypothetical protein
LNINRQLPKNAGLAESLVPIIRLVAGTKPITAATIQVELER